uniref:Uncharacterized protein n=1 Tax=Triticum urartu TaxID=4572 RepID=A0A8R7UZC6_TRIUA
MATRVITNRVVQSEEAIGERSRKGGTGRSEEPWPPGTSSSDPPRRRNPAPPSERLSCWEGRTPPLQAPWSRFPRSLPVVSFLGPSTI